MKRKKSFSMVGILIAKGTMMLAVVGCSIPASSNSINGISYAGTYSGEGENYFGVGHWEFTVSASESKKE